jgi:hypothetical protein
VLGELGDGFAHLQLREAYISATSRGMPTRFSGLTMTQPSPSFALAPFPNGAAQRWRVARSGRGSRSPTALPHAPASMAWCGARMAARPLNIVVVGGGPIGCAAAAAFARLSETYTVTVYDSEEDPSLEAAAAAGAAISLNMVLSKRGTRALRIIDVDVENTPQVFTAARGAVRHSKSKAPRVTLHDKVTTYTVEKVDFTRICRARASSAGVMFYHGRELLRLDPETNTAIFVEKGISPAPTALPVQYDMLVGCDGAQSKVRSELVRHAVLDVSSLSEPGYFKLFRLPPFHTFRGYQPS